jgi:hypothetical protein
LQRNSFPETSLSTFLCKQMCSRNRDFPSAFWLRLGFGTFKSFSPLVLMIWTSNWNSLMEPALVTNLSLLDSLFNSQMSCGLWRNNPGLMLKKFDLTGNRLKIQQLYSVGTCTCHNLSLLDSLWNSQWVVDCEETMQGWCWRNLIWQKMAWKEPLLPITWVSCHLPADSTCEQGLGQLQKLYTSPPLICTFFVS